VSKSCLEFVAAYRSSRVNCMTCAHWNSDDFVCMDKDELAKREKENIFDEMSQMMRRNRAVAGPL